MMLECVLKFIPAICTPEFVGDLEYVCSYRKEGHIAGYEMKLPAASCGELNPLLD